MTDNNVFRFWETRAKHSPDELFAQPALLWEAATEYFSQCTDNPLLLTGLKPTHKIHAFCMEGLYNHIGCNEDAYDDLKSNLRFKRNPTPEQKEMIAVLERIDNVVYQQKFIYAAGGLLHPSFIARDLGLYNKRAPQYERIRVRVGDGD